MSSIASNNPSVSRLGEGRRTESGDQQPLIDPGGAVDRGDDRFTAGFDGFGHAPAADDPIMHLDGATEVEVKERKDRVDKAMHATPAVEASSPEVVSLCCMPAVLDKLKGKNEDRRHGIEMVKKALSWPVRQIGMNACKDGSVVVGKIQDSDTYTFRFDA